MTSSDTSTGSVGSEGLSRPSGNSEAYRAALDLLGAGVVVLDADLSIRCINEQAVELFDLPRKRFDAGSTLSDLRRALGADGFPGSLAAYIDSLIVSNGMPNAPGRVECRISNRRVVAASAAPLNGGGSVHTFVDATERRGNGKSIREGEERYRLLVDNSVDVIVHSSLDAVRRYVSPSVEGLLGYSPEELVGHHPEQIFHPDDIAPCLELCRQLYGGLIARMVQVVRYRHKAGHWVWTEVTTSLAFDPVTNARIGFISNIRDIADRRKSEEALRLNEERLSLALGVESDGLWDWDLVSDRIEVPSASAVRTVWQSALQRQTSAAWYACVERYARAELVRQLREHLSGRKAILEVEIGLQSSEGTVWALIRGKVVDRAASGRPLRMVGTFIDVSRRKEAERQINLLALYDGLTELPNRILFKRRLDEVRIASERRGTSFAMLACDIDRFKLINDTLGHAVGDLLLRAVALRLRSVLGEHDIVARPGGDEFLVIIPELDGATDAAQTAKKLIDAAAEPFVIGGKPIEIGLSVGIAMGTGTNLSSDSLFEHADAALYQAKMDGRSVSRILSPETLALSSFRAGLVLDMRDAIRRREFRLVYQPVVDVSTGLVGSFEALMRWRHPARGEISPGDFIPIAEESGLIIPLGTWALREACKEAMSWPGQIRVAVNVSPLQFRVGLQDAVEGAMVEAGLPPRRLTLEVTESVLMLDSDSVLASLHALRNLGIRIALDDFGTGFSSLSYLRRFPFDIIKIDRAFIRDIEHPDTATIVRAIVGIGERLGMTVTAEGVETDRQLDRVRAEGCIDVQGFFFSRPIEALDARIFAARNSLEPEGGMNPVV